ncbi:MAG: FAD-dependent oxidoreductase, partial [Lachnospiraceae bacterium]|nr:FAD-dependent oxidoreductase [Lachnospiraceae bacterium]
EGGAGTFSDGKLNTGNKRFEDHETVLRTFVECGAPGEILYDAKPHIGTDRLREMIPNFRKRITALGGEFLFQSQFTGFRCDEKGRLSAVEINGTEWIHVSALIPAIGHSARDTYRMLLEKGVWLTPKAFAVGLRIEHEERMITLDRYGTLDYPGLGAAPYKLTYHAKDGRGVYSFCMCPGGFVVNASSEEGRTVVNGMSDYRRNAVNSNSAIVVQVAPSDYPGEPVLSGIRFQEILEERAYHAGNGRIPVQRFDDFLLNRKTVSFGSVFPSAKGGFTMGEVNSVFPEFIRNDIAESISYFGRIIRGFDNGDALLSAVESRTSSPVRIERDEKYESNIRGLFPAGEGAGYDGGILSSASDGIRTAEAVARSLGVLR